MVWLFPAVLAVLIASLALTGVYAYLWWQRRECHIGVWTAAWSLSSVRYAAHTLVLVGLPSAWFEPLSHLASLASAMVLAAGTHSFLQRRLSPWWLVAGGAAALWYLVGLTAPMSFATHHAPIYGLAGIALIWTGIAVLRHPELESGGRIITAWAMILWGFHRLDYPLLRPVMWFAPWGFGLSAVLEMVVAIGTLLMFIERALQDQRVAEARQRSVLENARDLVMEIDRQGRFTYLNPAWTRITGYRVEDCLGRMGADYVHPADRPVAEQVLRDLVKGQTGNVHVELRHIPRGGGLKWLSFSLSALTGAGGRVYAITGTASDITANKQAESVAAAAEARLRDAIERISDGFALWDASDCLRLFNERFRRLFPELVDRVAAGIAFEELMRLSVTRGVVRVPEAGADNFVTAQVRAHRRGNSQVEFSLSDGRWIAVSEYRTSDGGVVGLYADVTERREAELELRQAKEQAELASRAKSAFLANMSHELRTPLNAVLGFSQVIVEQLFGPVGSPKYLEYAQDIHNSGRHLLSLINDILDMAKVEAGRMELHESRIAVAEVVDAAVRLVRPTAEAAGLTLAVDVPPDLPVLLADERLVKQVLLNLLSNAIKFTEPGGRVELAVRSGIDGLSIAISDTGIGMTPEHIEIALKPFGQVDGPLARSHQGTGLGLPLSRSLVELHGGRLEIASALGRGTRITVYFPAGRLATEAAPVAARAGTAA